MTKSHLSIKYLNISLDGATACTSILWSIEARIECMHALGFVLWGVSCLLVGGLVREGKGGKKDTRLFTSEAIIPASICTILFATFRRFASSPELWR